MTTTEAQPPRRFRLRGFLTTQTFLAAQTLLAAPPRANHRKTLNALPIAVALLFTLLFTFSTTSRGSESTSAADTPAADTPAGAPPLVVEATKEPEEGEPEEGEPEEQVIVISVTRSERSASDLPVSATVIPRREVVNAPARTVDQLLRDVPSVQLQGDSADYVFPLNPSIAIRGIGVGDTATRALVLLDGIPINGGFFGNVLWNRVPKYSIERIEVVRGASSSLYGSFAMGGVVNIVTRRPARREGTVELLAGQRDRYQGNVYFAEVPSDKTALALNAGYFRTDGFFRLPEAERTPVEQRQGARLYNVQGRADFTPSDRMKAFFRLGRNDQKWLGGFERSRTDAAITDFATGLDIATGGSGLASLRAFYAREDYDTANVNVPDPFTSFISNRHLTKSDDFGFSAQWSRPLRNSPAGVSDDRSSAGRVSAGRVSAGLDFRRIKGEDDQDIFNAPGAPLASRVVGSGTQTSLGVFGGVSLKPSKTVDILGDLRFDLFKDTAGRIVTDGVAQSFSDRTLKILSPRVAGRWQFSRPVALRASYYTGFRAPTLAERYRSFESPTFRGLSNPDLREERLRGGDIGLDLRRGRLSAQLTGFYNRVKDFVGSAEVGFIGGKFTVQNANVAAIRSRGVEMSANYEVNQRLSFTTNYTYTDAKVVEGPLIGNAVEGAPKHAAALSLLYQTPSGLTVNARARYLSDSFQDITNQAPQEARWLFDLFAAWRVRENTEILLVGENLFDKRFIAEGFSRGLGAPRQLSMGVRTSF